MQRNAVVQAGKVSDDRVPPARLTSPPGTGKSHRLATVWVPKAVQQFGPGGVVICSLTRTAAREIASRVKLDRAQVGTLHSLCYRALGSPPVAEAKVDEWNKHKPQFCLSSLKSPFDGPEAREAAAPSTRRGDALMELTQHYRHNLVTDRALWKAEVRAFADAWDAWKGENNYVDFTDMIERALQETVHAPGNPAVLIVDEAQDCSRLELALVREWSRHASYAVLAGDSDQAIFQWRGASARAFLEPPVPAANNYELSQSYRVPRAVHAVAAAWIERAEFRHPVAYKPRNAEGAAMRARWTCRSPRGLVRNIEEYLADRSNKGKTCMVVASCAFMLRDTLKELRTRGVPFHNPYRPTQGAWNPLRAARRLVAFLVADKSAHGSDARPWTWKEMRQWTDLISARGVLARGAKARIGRKSEEKSGALRELTPEDIVATFERDALAALMDATREGRAVEWLVSITRPTRRQLVDYPARVYRRGGHAALVDEPRLTVGTIHSVKGGEADRVYVYPDLSPAGERQWVRRGDGRDEVIRTFYVAFTRAREDLVLCRRAMRYGIPVPALPMIEMIEGSEGARNEGKS